MKNASMGSLIRSARERSELTRAALAKQAKISAGYLGHLETDNHVHLSDVLRDRLAAKLGLSKFAAAQLKKLQKVNNERSRRWYRNHRKSA